MLAFSLASPLLAARPVVETERMMKDNAYQGVWLEKHWRLRTVRSEAMIIR